MTTNVPQPTFGPTGFVAPSAADIFAGRTADINNAFGGNLNPDPTTSQGQLATADTAIINYAYGVFCSICSQFDPAYATGRMQDGLARIYFLERNPAEPTVVQALCSGATGTVVPVGALAQSEAGDTYVSTAVATIGSDGTVTIPFACTATGPTPCPPASLTTIYRAIPGWDSITNSDEGVLGNDVEGREAFELRRAASVALNSVGSVSAIKAAVLNVTNVLDAYVTDNPTASTVTKGGVALDAFSLYVAVAGGAEADVAEAIWTKKMPGGPMTGTTTVVVTDSNSGYSLPYPTYSIKFTEATALPIFLAVTLEASAAIPADALAQIQNAIITAFAGGDGGTRAKIGATLLASRYYAPVANLGAWAQIVSLFIGTSADPSDQFSVSVDIDEIPTIIAANITVATT